MIDSIIKLVRQGLEKIKALREKGTLQSLSWKKKGKPYTAYFRNDLVLNGVHQDISTNYFEVIEIDSKTGEQTFYSSWITDILIDVDNIQELTEVARTRWKIENETFNTLKNQGYHFEHNYGHGKKHLATNFAILTFQNLFYHVHTREGAHYISIYNNINYSI